MNNAGAWRPASYQAGLPGDIREKIARLADLIDMAESDEFQEIRHLRHDALVDSRNYLTTELPIP